MPGPLDMHWRELTSRSELARLARVFDNRFWLPAELWKPQLDGGQLSFWVMEDTRAENPVKNVFRDPELLALVEDGAGIVDLARSMRHGIELLYLNGWGVNEWP